MVNFAYVTYSAGDCESPAEYAFRQLENTNPVLLNVSGFTDTQ